MCRLNEESGIAHGDDSVDVGIPAVRGNAFLSLTILVSETLE